MRGVHKVASSGFDSSNVTRYEAARPGYRAEVVHKVSSIIGDCNKVVVELGAGTGKFSKAMIGSMPKGSTYLATEPSAAFRENMKELGIEHPGFQVAEGTGERIPVEDGSCDAIVVAQAFHWMANENTLREMKRCLKRGGKIIMVWNAIDTNILWHRKLEESILGKRYGGEKIPRYITGEWEEVFKSETASSFSSLIKWSTAENFKRASTAQDIVDRILSVSVVARLSEEEQKECAQEVLDLLKSHEETKGKTELHLEYRSDVAYCHIL